MTRFMLGAYWDERPDSLEFCTDAAWRLFAQLKEIDPLLAHWYEPGTSRKDALKRKVDTSDKQRLRELLLKRRARRDIGGEVMEDLGFRIGLWNGAGKDEAEASVDINCGCYCEHISNNVLIDLPWESKNAKWVENASSLLALVAKIWRPQWAGIMSRQAMRERNFEAEPFVDWMVYVPRSVKAVPLPSRVVEVNGLGSIVIVQPEPPSGNRAVELSLIRQVERLLSA